MSSFYNASSITNLYRKVQSKIVPGMKFLSDEYDKMSECKTFDVDWSAREVTVPIELTEGGNVAVIDDGDFEALPSSPTLDEISLSLTAYNKRFTMTVRGRILNEKQAKGLLVNELTWKGKKALEAIASQFSNDFHGSTTGVLAVNTTVGTGATLNLVCENLAGLAYQNTAAAFPVRIKVGERVALIRGGALVANSGGGVVTAVGASNRTVSVTFPGSVTSANGDLLVLANSVQVNSVAQTQFGKGFVTYNDVATATSLHGLSSTTQPNWTPAFLDQAGGRFDGIRLERAKDLISNVALAPANRVMWAQGVKRDVLAQYQQYVRFASPFAIDISQGGDKPAKGFEFWTSRRVPNGVVCVYNDEALKRINIHDKPTDAVDMSEAVKHQDKSGYTLGMDYLTATVCTSRKGLGLFTGLTEQ